MNEKEYEALRTELNENRKYVFERPLVILTVTLIGFQNVDNPAYLLLLPSLMIFLLIFNLHFTSNRVNSSARIISYIRIFIEQDNSKSFFWETFLSLYRKSDKIIDIKSKENEWKQSDKSLRDKALRYYPIIFYFHVFIIIILFCIEFFEYSYNSSLNNSNLIPEKQIIAIIPLVINIISLIYFIAIWKFSYPRKVNKIFFREGVIVQKIYNDLKHKSQNIKINSL
jgi:hypothetical protein